MVTWSWLMPTVCGLLVVVSIAMILNNTMKRRRAQEKWPTYRYEDFLEDLKNPSVSIDWIITKCGGTIPREWEERISPAPEKAAVGPVEAGPVPVPVPAPAAGDRAQVRRDWFNKLAVSTPVIPVVPPPAVPAPVPMIKGWIIHCKWCIAGHGLGNTSLLARPDYMQNPGSHRQTRYINTCQYCGGKGMVMITGG